MRFITLASAGLFALFNVAVSQSLSGLPTCAQSCALNSISSTGCSVSDVHCICTATSFLSGVETCIQTACSAADQAATLQFAQSFCLSANVTITAPTQQASATASNPVSSATGSASMTSAPASTTATMPATTAASSSAAPAATYTGAAAPILRQEWAGLLGAIGLGAAALL